MEWFVEITNSRDPVKHSITVKEKNHSGGCNVKAVEIRMSEKKEILMDLIFEECTILGKLTSLPLSFRYHPRQNLNPLTR